MGCRCQERRFSLARTAQAIRDGDGQAVTTELAFVVTSTVQDVASTFREKAATARAALMSRSTRR
jgi:hypothetical protein